MKGPKPTKIPSSFDAFLVPTFRNFPITALRSLEGSENSDVQLSAEKDELSSNSSVVQEQLVAKVKVEDPEIVKMRIEAEKLKLQAQKMKLEAEKEELVLQEQKLKEKEQKMSEQAIIINSLRPIYGEDLVREVKRLVDKRQVDSALFLRIAAVAEEAGTPEETDDLRRFADRLMGSLEAADPKLGTEIRKDLEERARRRKPGDTDINVDPGQRELLEKWLANYENTTGANVTVATLTPEQVQKLLDGSAGQYSVPGLGSFVALPNWIPPALVRFVVQNPVRLDGAELPDVARQLFPEDEFYVRKTEKCEFAWLVRGSAKVRKGREEDGPGAPYDRALARLEANVTLAERYQLFYLPDPVAFTPEGQASGAMNNPEPVFLIFPKEVVPEQPKLGYYGFALASAVFTAGTAYTYGLGTFALNANFLKTLEAGPDGVSDTAFQNLVQAPLPIMGGILAVLLIHELGHLVAAGKWGLKMSTPLPYPSLQIGSFGAETRLLSFAKNRKALFDFAVAGPAAGALASVALYLFGLAQTATATPEALATFPVVPGALFHTSLLAGILSAFVNPAVLLTPAASPVAVHPFAVAGLAGLIASALNFMPIGRLDGGRASMAAFGRPGAAAASTFMIVVQALLGFTQPYSIQFYWGLIVVFFQRQLENPSLDEVSQIDGTRKAVLFLAYLLTMFTLVPFPDIGV